VTTAQRPPSQVVIGLDVGTTAVKAVAFGLDSDWRRMAIREYPLLAPAPGRHEQDPKTILTATTAALTDCVDAVGDAEVLAISLSAAMHGLIALDATMHPITPLVTRPIRALGDRRGRCANPGWPPSCTGAPARRCTR
jgi:gluconokinase